MANRSRRARPGKSKQIIQDSRLLNLPPELRNLIYEFVAKSSSTISVRENEILSCQALSSVCRQIRTEYKKIYLDEAPKYASRVNIHITNFVTFSSRGGAASRIHEILPEPVAGIERSFTVRVFMTNFWDSHRLDLRNFIEHGDFLNTKFDLEIVWDPKTFDMEFLRETVQKLRFCHARNNMHPAHLIWRTDLIWLQVEKALLEAFERYTPPAKSPPARRKRKRKTKKVEDTPKKVQRRR
jgi:hypothetical protein